MAQLKNVVEPFGEVNVYPAPDGKLRVVATILMEPRREGTQTGIALDGSGSMAASTASSRSRRVLRQPVRQEEADRQRDHAGRPEGLRLPGPQARRRRRHHLHLLGDRARRQPGRGRRRPHRRPGRAARLRPAQELRHRHAAPAGGEVLRRALQGRALGLLRLHHRRRAARPGRRQALQHAAGPGHRRRPAQAGEVRAHRRRRRRQRKPDGGAGRPRHRHRRRPVGPQAGRARCASCRRSSPRSWTRTPASPTRRKILDPQDRVVKNYSDTGLPALLEFELPAGSAYFVLEVEGKRIQQPVT